MTPAWSKQRAKALLSRYGVLYDAATVAQMVLRYLTRRPHETDFRVFARLPEPVLFADIGANRGQSALSFARCSRLPHRIVSFEANTENGRYLRVVRRLLGRRHEVHLVGLGDTDTTREFFVPVQGSHRITGEGSFSYDNVIAAGRRISGPYDVATQTFTIKRFDSFDLAPEIVKIDVQGLELSVLRGMGDLPSRPLLMIEANPAEDAAVLAHLAPLGYERFEVGPAGTLQPGSANRRPLNWFYATATPSTAVAPLFA